MAKQKTTPPKVKSEIKKEKGFSLTGERYYPLIVFAFSFLLYFNSVFNDYNMDDELVTQNHRLTSKGISAIPEIFTSPYYQDKAGYQYEYRPVVLVSFAIENSFFGERVWVSHLINVLLYALMCLLLFYVLKKLLKQYSLLFPFLIALVFVAHPVHTEVVDSIKNRDEILSLLFGLLSLDFAIRFTERKNVLHLLAMGLFFLLGILSKTTTITFVMLIPLALVLLSEISFGYLMAVTTVLVLPAVFFARANSLSQQIGLTFLLFAASVSLYFLKHTGTVFISVKNFIFSFLHPADTEQTDSISIDVSLDFGFLKNKLSVAFFVLAVAVLAVVSGLGFYYCYWWMACVPLFFLALIFLFVRTELKLLMITPIALVLVLAFLKFHSYTLTVEAAIVVFLAAVILQGSKPFRIVGVVNYIIYAAAVIIFKPSFFFLTIFIFALLQYKRTYLFTLVALLVSVVFYVKGLFPVFAGSKPFVISQLSLPVIYLGVLFVWRQKTKWLLLVSVLMLPVITGLYFTTSNSSKTDALYVWKHNYFKFSKIEATDFTPVKAVRPLVFIEMPLDRDAPLNIKAGTAMLVLSKYLKLIFVPYPLSYYYGYSYISPVSITEAVPLISLVVHLVLLGIALFFFRRQPLLAFGILFYLIAIAAFSNLVIPIPGMMGDRLLLIPSIGYCVAIVLICAPNLQSSIHGISTINTPTWWFVGVIGNFVLFFASLLIGHHPATIAFVVTTTTFLLYPIIVFTSNEKSLKKNRLTYFRNQLLYSLIYGFAILTVYRNFNWKDHLTLFSHDINTVENSAQAQNLLGVHLFIASNKETDPVKRKAIRQEALPHFEKAIAIYPKFLNAAFDRARLLDAMQRYDEALAAYRLATTIDTVFSAPYFSMGVIYDYQKNPQAAAVCYERFLSNHPQQLEAYANLGFDYFKLKQFDKSIEVNHRALAAMPTAFDPVINIAKTYRQMGVTDSALIYFEKAKVIRPNFADLDVAIAGLKNKPK